MHLATNVGNLNLCKLLFGCKGAFLLNTQPFYLILNFWNEPGERKTSKAYGVIKVVGVLNTYTFSDRLNNFVDLVISEIFINTLEFSINLGLTDLDVFGSLLFFEPLTDLAPRLTCFNDLEPVSAGSL